jgi:hypothetical protein
MMQGIKSFTLGFLVAGLLFVFAPAVASVAQVEKQISKFVGSFKCRTVEVQDIDLWGGRVLVKSNEMGLSFVMVAKDSATYDICPVGVGVTNFQALEKKK